MRTRAANPEEVDLGRIENVCGASAEYCYKLETAAMAYGLWPVLCPTTVLTVSPPR